MDEFCAAMDEVMGTRRWRFLAVWAAIAAAVFLVAWAMPAP